MELLKELYYTFSPSFKEKEMSKLVQKKLKVIGINDFKVDSDYQIYRLRENKPLLCAHMDQVSRERLTKLFISPDGNHIYGNRNLGADDKNGIWIILNLLRENKDLSFIFSTGEECGCNITLLLDSKPEILNTIPYGLVFDRTGNSDIIGTKNEYCEKDLEDDIYNIGKDLGYFPVTGVFSDCDKISYYIPCVNISCGYYGAHTKKEFTNISDLKRSLLFGQLILNKLKNKYYNRVELQQRFVFKSKYDKVVNFKDRYSKSKYTDDYEIFDPEVYYCHTCSSYFSSDDINYLEYTCPFCNSDNIEIEYYDEDICIEEMVCPFCNIITSEIIKDDDLENKICKNCGSELEPF